MKQLSKASFKQAETFLRTQTRPLEYALFSTFLKGAPAEWALSELASFQNDDGGFGHGLEPDFQLAGSSVLATTVALQYLRDLSVSSDNPLVEGSMRFLMDTYDNAALAWPIIPPQGDEAPHAPWWQHDPDLSLYIANPRAEIVGYLFEYPEHVRPDLTETLLRAVLNHLENLEGEMKMHDLLCYVRLAETDALPTETREFLHTRLQPIVQSAVATAPTSWRSYGLKPLLVAPAPSSLFADTLQHVIRDNLNFEIDEQQMDGSWAPNWSWEDAYPEAWPHAKRAWQGILTVTMTRSLTAYGRILLE